MDTSEICDLEPGSTYVSQLQSLAKKNPEKAAYVFFDKDFNRRVLTRQDLWEKAKKFSAILRRDGVTKGDIVCNALVNSPERLITCFGTMTAGAISMHGQVLRADGVDLIRSLKLSQCKAIVVDPGDEVGAHTILDKIKVVDKETAKVRYEGLPDLDLVYEVKASGLDDSQRWISSIDKEEDMFVDESVSPDDTVGVFTTSGTTGFSKLVIHTHSTLLNFMPSLNNLFGINKSTVYFNANSMGWLGGFPALYPRTGTTRVLIDNVRGAPSDMGTFILRMFNREKVNLAALLTRDIHLVNVASADGTKLDKRLSKLFTGGGPVHTATMEAIGKITDSVFVAYGASEFCLASHITITDPSDFIDMCSGNQFYGDIKFIGEDEEDLPVGQMGEILVRSPCLFKGYLNEPIKTSQAYAEGGWYKTGDIGYKNTSGQLFVLCRKSDAINKDGFIHYPGWMEKLVNKIPAIKNSVVIGIPDPIHHEEICLCMKLVPGATVTMDEIRDHCKKLFLTDASDKITPIPTYYLFFDDFLTNQNGKVDRRRMRQEACKRLNIQ